MKRVTLLLLVVAAVAPGCGDPLAYQADPAPVRPPGTPHPDASHPVDASVRDLAVPVDMVIRVDAGVPDLAVRDFSVVRDLTVTPPDLRVVDLAVPRDLVVADLTVPPDAQPDIAIPMNKCRTGKYTGPWSGTMAGFQVSGTITLTFGLPVNQQLIVNPGKFTGTGPANSTVDADVTGILDCRALTFGGLFQNGVATILGNKVNFDGQLDANYDMNNQALVMGTWSAMEVNGVARGMGMWSAK